MLDSIFLSMNKSPVLTLSRAMWIATPVTPTGATFAANGTEMSRFHAYPLIRRSD
ncbi:hypothetical protein [Pseudomonas caspiana]|uniref:hypothetical protein n=1 Tax=Pseudomonas caspiana TaxID=1451454 RepID=UPI0032EDE4E7